MTITTTNSATGQPSNALTLSSPLNATATVRDAKGAPVANAIVQFTASASGGSSSSSTAFVTFSPASANGITDANGNVTVVLSAGSVSSSGAGTLSAQRIGGRNLRFFQRGDSGRAGQHLAAEPRPQPGDDCSIPDVDDHRCRGRRAATTPVSVNFSSVCASAKKATITPTALTVNGTATANYSDNGCGQADTIIVSASGAPSVQGTLTIQPAAATNLVFVSANPDVMGIQGSGANTSSVVTFKVVDAGQQPVANVAVTMALDTVVGGVALENGQATQTKTTAADGTVTTQVVAGTQPTPVRVRASTASGLTAVSSNLTIQSGLPTQARFSLSVETFNIEGWNIDGTKTKVTIRAADRVGNPVPDNTVINFRSSGAALQPSCRTTGGACTVEFVSQANRPLTAPVGRITVLANASGLESFQDANGNNRYDMGEPFEDLGDAFVDNNFDRTWQAGEDFIPYNAAATAACATGLASTPPPMKPMTCDGVWGGAQVRAQTQIILSGRTRGQRFPVRSICRRQVRLRLNARAASKRLCST